MPDLVYLGTKFKKVIKVFDAIGAERAIGRRRAVSRKEVVFCRKSIVKEAPNEEIDPRWKVLFPDPIEV